MKRDTRQAGLERCQDLVGPKPIDRRVRRTIAALHQAVLDLLPEKPFEAITVQDIADRADVSRAAFYANFTDKFALMEHIIDDVFDRSIIGLDNTAGEERIRALCLATCNYLQQIFTQCRHARRLLDPLIQARVGHRLKDLLVMDLEAGAALGIGTAGTIDLTASVLSWSIYGSALGWANQPDRGSAEAFVETGFPTIASAYHAWRQAPFLATLPC